jgi:hypothetical protein
MDYTWRDFLDMDDKFLEDPANSAFFDVVEHPDFPMLSQMDPQEVIGLIQDVLEVEGRAIHLKNMYLIAPMVEYTIGRQNLPIL